jgi:predicted O-methyltransferase YrrM
MATKPRYDGIDIHSALDSIGSAFGFDADTLIDYAALDPHGGYHPKEGGDGFPIGSIWRVEGQILYALVRALAEQTRNIICLELGTHRGCSATHIAQAIEDAGNGGMVVGVDLNGAAGDLIPAHLRHRVELMNVDMFKYLPQQKPATFDFILEDGSHGADDVAKVWNAAHTLLKPGGLILSHDAEHFVVGADVREGIARAGYFGVMPPARTYLIEPSDCGFAIWRKPFDGLPGDVLVNEPDAETPKRKNDELPTVGSLLETPDLSTMTIAELKQFADKRGIELTGARTKGAIIAAIEAVK